MKPPYSAGCIQLKKWQFQTLYSACTRKQWYCDSSRPQEWRTESPQNQGWPTATWPVRLSPSTWQRRWPRFCLKMVVCVATTSTLTTTSWQPSCASCALCLASSTPSLVGVIIIFIFWGEGGGGGISVISALMLYLYSLIMLSGFWTLQMHIFKYRKKRKKVCMQESCVTFSKLSQL